MIHINAQTEYIQFLMDKIKIEDTVLLELNDVGEPIKLWKFKNGSWVIEKDYIDWGREFLPEEKEEFKKTITKENVVDYFLNGHMDDHPFRENSVYSELEDELFNYVTYNGTYVTLSDDKYMGCYKICIGKDSNLDEVYQEVLFVLNRIENFIYEIDSNIVDYEFEIFEKTVGQYGCYSAYVDLIDKTVEITLSKWGKESVEKKFETIMDALKHIKENLYY